MLSEADSGPRFERRMRMRTGPGEGPGEGPPPLHGADADGNGTVSAAEWQALFAELDADGNGELSQDELPMRPLLRSCRSRTHARWSREASRANRNDVGSTTMSRQEIISSDPEILGGTPVFAGTRIPVEILIDYLKAGDSLERFLAGFPTVRREQAQAFLEVALAAALKVQGHASAA